MDQKVIDDLQAAAEQVDGTKDLLTRLYYHPDFSTLFTRPVLSMLIAACDYLSSNLLSMAEKYRMR